MKLPRWPQSIARKSRSSHPSEQPNEPAGVMSECTTRATTSAGPRAPELRFAALARYRGDVLGRLSLLLGQLGRAVAAAGPPQDDAVRSHPAVGRAMRLLEADIARHWTLTALADELHLAPGYLVRLFKSATGLPPMAYLAQVRAEQAAVLLLHSDEPVTCIGRAVGWPDQNYFARRFRAHYGLSATTYRQRFATKAGHLRFPDDPVTRQSLLA
jgi:AraC family transcriptional regulator, L-rhamnose operon transcriptional activator RhaR